MPSLKEYTDTSDKSGFYILANVGGSHPITLQVTSLGEKILQKSGYSSGNNVPTKIVWSMFDIGILYTSSTINNPPDVDEGADEIFNQLGVKNELTEQERAELLRYLSEYEGPDEERVAALQSELQNEDEDNKHETPEELQEDLDRISRLRSEGELTDEEYRLLKSRLLDDTGSSNRPHSTPDVSTSATSISNWLSEETIQDIMDAYRAMLPKEEPGPYADDQSSNGIIFQISVLPEKDDQSAVTVANAGSGPYSHLFSFFEREQERRFRDHVKNIDSYEIEQDRTDSGTSAYMTVRFNNIKSGYYGDVPDEVLLKEIDDLFGTICITFDVSKEDISQSNIGVSTL